MPADWLTPDDVGAYLDLAPALVAVDDNLALSTAAIKAAVERRRSDLWAGTEPDEFAPGDDVRGGAIVWAALFYQARSGGTTGAGDTEMMFDSLGARRAEVMRLLGWRRPVAR